jgi:hypothetical protein
MTDEEQVLKSLEDLVNEAQEKMRKEQIQQHQNSMAYFRTTAAKHTEGMEAGGLHLFVIAQAGEVPEGVTPEDPLGLGDSPDQQHLVFQHFHQFDNPDQAVALLSDLKAAIVAHHAREGEQLGFFMVFDDQTTLLYASAKLTIQRSVSPTENITFTADISRDLKRIAAAVMFFAEGGSEFQRSMPDTYEVILKRILEGIDTEDESDD